MMTGKFTCTLSYSFSPTKHTHLKKKRRLVKSHPSNGQAVLEREDVIQHYVNLDHNRVIYLGSGSLSDLL